MVKEKPKPVWNRMYDPEVADVTEFDQPAAGLVGLELDVQLKREEALPLPRGASSTGCQ